MRHTIVIAWTEEQEVFDGQSFAADLGARPGMKSVRTAYAAVWLNKGNKADIAKAEMHAAENESRRVFVYPTSERKPLERARKEILAR